MADSIPNAVFELDGNSVTADTCMGAGTSPAGCDDWNLLNGDGTGMPPGAAGNSLARSFISEPAGVNVFQGGGSKDPIDIPSWKWKNGSTPDKDTITNGYAAGYKASNGDFVLVFGADRFAQNGDANIGLWFFQQDVHPVGATGGGFSGAHTLGDLFVVSAFTQGGGVSTITAYEWDPSCVKGVHNFGVGDCAESNLRLKFASMPSASCAGVSNGCALTNPTDALVSWPYLAKFGSNSQTIPAGGLYEGGIDVTAVLGTSNLPCFSTFLIETRSAQTPSAVLKDFVSGSFNICGVSLTKSCAGPGVLNTAKTAITYTFNGTVKNTGIGTLSNVTIADTLPSGATNVQFTPAGGVFSTLGPNGMQNWSVSFDLNSLSAANSAIAKAATASGGTPGNCGDPGTVCSTSSGDSCSASVSNGISITKNCGVPIGFPGNVGGAVDLPGTQLVTESSRAVVQVNFSGMVCNTGDTPLSGVTVTDDPAATISLASTTLAPKGQTGECATYSGSYKPSGASGLGLGAGRYGFSDNVYVTGAKAALGSDPAPVSGCMGNVPSGVQACNGTTCNICPGTPGGLCSGN